MSASVHKSLLNSGLACDHNSSAAYGLQGNCLTDYWIWVLSICVPCLGLSRRHASVNAESRVLMCHKLIK